MTDTTKGIAIYVTLFFIVWTIRATVLFPIDKSIASPELRQIYADVLRVLIWVLPVFAYVAWVDKNRPVEYLRLNTFGNKKAVFQLSMIVFLYFVLILLVEFTRAGFSSGVIFSPFLISNSWLRTTLLIGVGPTCEEILYRGFLLQKLQAITGDWKANLITSVLFIAIHMHNWIYTGNSLLEILTLSVSIFPLSVLLGYMMQKAKTLWPSILTHMLNNMISFYIHFG